LEIKDLKKIKVNQLKLVLHPKVLECISNDIFEFGTFPDFSSISNSELGILLNNITLNIASLNGQYYLIEYNQLFNYLSKHPLAPNKSINLLIHNLTDETELFEIIDTLLLVKPSLSLLFNISPSTIHARFCQLNKFQHKATSLTQLAKYSNKTKSAFRS
jgi:hypothetical protein